MEKATRILVANRPKLMRDVVLATLSDQPGIEIVGEVSDETQILRQVQATLPDLLVIGLDEPEQRPAICDLVLRDHPGATDSGDCLTPGSQHLLLGIVRHSFRRR